MFSIDFEHIIRLILPRLKRTPLRTAWIIVIVSGLKAIYQYLTEYRVESNYKASMNGQTIYLEKRLNDYFNSGNSGIEILPHNVINYIYVMNNNEGVALYTQNSPSASVFLTDTRFYNNLLYFEVLIPSGVSAPENQVRAILDKYIYASRRYNITYE